MFVFLLVKRVYHNENENFLHLEFFNDNSEIINYYKIIPNKTITIDNLDKFNINIYDLHKENTNIDNNNANIKFITDNEYIKIIATFNKGIYKYYPLIIK